MQISQVSAQIDTSLSDVLAAGEIHVGVDAAYPPFEQKNPSTDEIEGFDVDIMEAIAADMGVDIVWHDVAWDVIFTSLATGDYDCVCSAVTITEQRQQTMNFTRWYYKSTQAVMVGLDNPKNITAVEDLNNADLKIGLQSETTSHWYLQDEGIDLVADVVGYDTITLAIQALHQGSVDVVIGDYAPLWNGKTTYPDEFAVIDTFSPEDFGIACKGGAIALVDRMNVVLNGLLGSDLENPVFNATYNASHLEWFGVLPNTDYLVDDVPAPSGSGIPGFPIIGLIAIIPVTTLFLIRKNRK
jgi:polar amino acid transport system substrate-binding protein